MPEEQNSSDHGSHSILLQAGNSLPPTWNDEQDESLNEVFRVLRKRKSIIIGCLVATVAIAGLACILITKKYKASATVELNKDSSAFETSVSSTLANALSGSNDLKTELQTASTIMQSPSVVIAVIEKLNLRSSEDFQNRPKAAGKAQSVQNSESIPLDQAPAIRDPLVQRFKKNLKVEAVPDTRLLTITYTSRNPQQAALVANTIVEEYKRQYLHSHYASVQDASEWLTDQLSGLKEKVQSSEKRLADFQRQTGILGFDQLTSGAPAKGSVGGGGGGFMNPALDKFSALNHQLTSAEVNRVTKEAIYKLAQTRDPNVVAGLANSPLVVDGTSAVVVQGGGLGMLATLQQQQNALKVEYADAVTKYGPKNPRLLDFTNRIAEVDVQIKQELKNIAERARNDYELSRKVEDGIRHQFELQQQQANRINDQATQFQILWQEAASNQALYQDLYTKLQEANVSAGVKASNITIADPARAPFAPVIPNIPLFLAVGVGAGLFLGVSGAFLRENIDRSVVASSQVESITHSVVLGMVPDFSTPALHRYGYGARKKREEQIAVNAIFAANSSIAESFQSLRTSILLSRAGAPPKLISITSAIAGEGKTTVSTNLAAAFASHGSRVLLIDGDMRKSRLARSMNMDKGVGLSNVLTGTLPFDDAVVDFPGVSNLSLMIAGPRPPTPAELLGSERFTKLLDTASERYDFVFVDTPPAVLVTDAVLISPKMDGTICVVRAGVTTRPLLYRVSELLRRSKCHFLGFALNAVQTGSADYYHYYGYHGNGDYYDEAKT